MAVYPVSAGHPDYSSTGTNGFIPAIWSTKLVVNYYRRCYYTDIANTEYEGEIKRQGDTVNIRTIGSGTVRTHRMGQKVVYDVIESAKVQLLVDKGQSYAFSVDRVFERQSDINWINEWSKDGAQQMKVAIDADVINNVYTDAAAANIGTTAGAVSSSYNLGTTAAPVAITKSNVLDYMVDCGSVMSEQNLPEEDRWMLIPGWMENLLSKSDLKDASMMGDTESSLRKQALGRIKGMMVYTTNNYTAVSDSGFNCYNVLFGHKKAITFAAQITETETLKNPDAYGDLVRTLMVYGYEVIKPAALGVLYCRKGS